ncbi:MAG: hydrogenase iron-sulfur subunit [Acidobacteriota bacterium]
MAEKIGVYVCGGCGLGEAVDLDAVCTAVKNKYQPQCPVIKTVPVLCSSEGKAAIDADIAEAGLDAVCLCACSPRAKWDVFTFGDKIQVERVNLREQGVWSFNKELGALEKAKGFDDLQIICNEYAMMGVVKMIKSNIPNPDVPETCKTIMVLGGGWTGLNAANAAASLGYDVVLVEQAANLGGKVANFYKTFPLSYPYTEAHETGLDKLITQVTTNSKVSVLTGTTLEKLSGAPGLYKAELSGGQNLDIGAVVLATGWVPGDTKYLAPMGYGEIKNVITTAELEKMAKDGPIVRPSDGKAPKSVAFLTNTALCSVDSCPADVALECEKEEQAPVNPPAEGEEAPAEAPFCDLESQRHLALSSELSSLVALKQANYVVEKDPEAAAYIFYDHMMVPGINERYYKAAQDNPGVMLSKAQIKSVKAGVNGSVVVSMTDTLLGEAIEIEADLVVLPTSLVPTTAHSPVVNLEYRQGLAFPDLGLFEGYADSNYICFPYETRRTGIYAAGAVRQPMGLALASEDAMGAALKAIQCVSSANRGVAVHPRSGDRSFPVFNFVRCTQCKRCTEECPFGALDDDPKGTPMPNPSRCRRCGTCMGACPERVISFDNYNIDMIGTMIREMQVPAKMDQGGPRVLILACENDAYPALDMAAMRGKPWSPYVRVIPVRCLGSVNAIWVADAMSKGIDGVLLLGCKYGDDYQCHFVKGSELCNRRKENISESLKRLGVEPERVDQFQVAIDEYDVVPSMIDKFMDMIVKMGPNPFKGY